MGSKILAAIIIVVILLVGIFLLAPNAFDGIVPDEYMPDQGSTVSDTEIHWQTTAAMTTSAVAVVADEVESTVEEA